MTATSAVRSVDPAYGARAIVAAMGEDYALRLIDSLTSYLRDKKEGDA